MRHSGKKIVVGALFALLGAAQLAAGLTLAYRRAYAHDPYSWIMDNPDTSYCCGPQDCERVDASQVGQAGGRYTVDGHPVDPKDVHQTRNGKFEYWVCYYMGDDYKVNKSDPHCLFVPFTGAGDGGWRRSTGG